MTISNFEEETGYIKLDTEDEITILLDKIDHFHDCCCHSVLLLYDACVFQDGKMLDNSGLNIKLLFHSQFIHECPAFEIIFSNVSRFVISETNMGASYNFSFGFKGKSIFITDNYSNSFYVEAGEACYKMLPVTALPMATEIDSLNDSDISSVIRKFEQYR